MNCRQVLDLVDAGALSDLSRGQPAAVRRHLANCVTCRQALETATALAHDLSALPTPRAPAHLAAAVMARVARHEAPPVTPRARPRAERWSLWAVATGGVMAAAAVVVNTPAPLLTALSPHAAGGANAAWHSTLTAAALIAGGAGLYAAGLLSTLHRRAE